MRPYWTRCGRPPLELAFDGQLGTQSLQRQEPEGVGEKLLSICRFPTMFCRGHEPIFLLCVRDTSNHLYVFKEKIKSVILKNMTQPFIMLFNNILEILLLKI